MPDGERLARHPAALLVTLPNAITFARICAVPLAVWLVLRHDLAGAFWLFVAAGLSDAVDGWLARRHGGTALGAVLDPMADKALLVSMYITLASIGVLPDWLAILVVFRDAVIVGGVLVMAVLGQPVMIRPIAVSKVNTALQIVLVAFVLLLHGFSVMAPIVDTVLIWAVAGSTLASGAGYAWRAASGR